MNDKLLLSLDNLLNKKSRNEQVVGSIPTVGFCIINFL